MLLSWAWAFTASKLRSCPECLVFWLSLEWHKPAGLSGSQMKVGDGLNLSPVPPGSLDACYSVLSELFKDKESPPIWSNLIDYSHWNLHYWFTFLKESILAYDLCMIFGGSSCILSYCFHFSVLANNLPAGFQFPYCVIVVWWDWPYFSMFLKE